MAEGLTNYYLGDRYVAKSAGSKPSRVHPLAIAVMKELGIDISQNRSKSVREFWGMAFDYVATVCGDDEECPYFAGGRKYLHKSFPDPAAVQGSEEEKLEAFRTVRDSIKEWILKEFGRQTSKLFLIAQKTPVSPIPGLIRTLCRAPC
ncbi:arsenate reductase ArsC [Tardisphaera miroshnichenkoae]